MTSIPLSDLLDVAICAAEAAGHHALENKERRTETAEIFAHDVKLVLDMECQQVAEQIIAREFPEHGILGEEGSRTENDIPYEWIIDPIDGTVNYAHGVPYWCCSIAVRRHDKVLAGCVHAPESGEFYTAHIEAPAQCNSRELSVSDTRHLSDAMIFTGLNKHLENDRNRHFDAFRMLALNTQKLRINGSAALDLCRVAAGQSDGYYESGIYLWDYAAAGLIAEQAGAHLAIYPHKNSPNGAAVLCANEHLIEGLRAVYTKCL